MPLPRLANNTTLCFILLFALFLGGCAKGLFTDSRLDDGLSLGRKAGLSPVWIETDSFRLLAQIKVSDPSKPLRLYIEGDGFAYSAPGQTSLDPTPRKPMALILAALDPAANVAWLARPCQYALLASKQTACPARYWTTHRMAENVVDSLGKAVDFLLRKTGSAQLELIGYSGGASAAVLLAARRDDVLSVRTVAGNLDYEAFTRFHNVDPMRDSLDAKSVAAQVKALAQIHFAGEKDEIVPPVLARAYLQEVGAKARTKIVLEASHTEGWEKAWPRLLIIEPNNFQD